MQNYIIDLNALCNEIICNLYDNNLIVNGEENFNSVKSVLLFHLEQIDAIKIV